MTDISIVTVTYNSITTIKDTIASINSQKYSNIKKIWIDGMSTDGTYEFLKQSKDENTVLISEKDEGLYDALNKGIQKSSTDLIFFLHSDDFFSDDNIISSVIDIFNNQKPNLVYGNIKMVDENLTEKTIRYWKSDKEKNYIRNNFYYKKKILNGWMPPHTSCFYRTDFLKKIGYFNLNYKISADYDHLLRLFMSDDLKAFYINKTIVNMRMGGNSNRSVTQILKKMKEDYEIINKNKLLNLYTLFMKSFSKLTQFFIKK